jgi:hypothetical protein
MNLKVNTLLIATSAILGFTSCDSDDDVSVAPQLIETPATYSFERNGNSSVSYPGQTTRILMAEELVAGLNNSQNTEAQLLSTFAHTAGEDNFTAATLNASDKSVRSKVAASSDFFAANSTDQAAIRADFEGFISGQVNEVFPAWANTASAGVPGQLQQAGGGTTRYLNAKGLEYNQAFAKSLIGALMMDQMLNNYLSPAVLDEASNRGDNEMKVLSSGSNYTVMEHKWDEAFGYLYGTETDPLNPELNADSFLNKYLSSVDNDTDFTGIAADIYDAFKLGRAAIVAGEYDLRGQQADIIKTKISEIAGIRAVYYLQNGKNDLNGDKAKAFHALSEAYGFIYSLQFTRVAGTDQPFFTKNEVDEYLNQLMVGNGFWDVTPATLDQISVEISDRFDFTMEQAKY